MKPFPLQMQQKNEVGRLLCTHSMTVSSCNTNIALLAHLDCLSHLHTVVTAAPHGRQRTCSHSGKPKARASAPHAAREALSKGQILCCT